MNAVFYATCIKGTDILTKGKRYGVIAVNGNKFTLTNTNGEFESSLFQMENAYFALGKQLPVIGKPLNDIIRFTGDDWKKVTHTSDVESIALLNECTFVVVTKNNMYIYQLSNPFTNLACSLVETLPIYLAIGNELPSLNTPLQHIHCLVLNKWEKEESPITIKECYMLSIDTFLLLTKERVLVYKVRA